MSVATENRAVGEPRAGSSGQNWLRHGDTLCCMALVLVGILFFSDFLFTSKNFYFRDILNFHYPLRRILIDAYSRGQFPLWNPYLHLGQPLLANPNYLAFYPTNLFHLLFSFNYAFKLHFIIHPILGALGMYAFQRRLGITSLACLGGAVAYEFSGIVLSFLNLYNIVPAVALMPWMAWGFKRAVDNPRWPRIVVFSTIVAVQVLAFEPLMIQCEIMLLGGLAILAILSSENRRTTLRNTAWVGVAGGSCAAGISAVQVLPSLELIARSARGAGFSLEDSSTWSTHPMDLINLVVPNFFGNPFVIGYARSWGESYHHGREGYLVSCFIGASTVVIALVGLLSARKRLSVLFGGLGALGLAMAMGRFSPIYTLLTRTKIFGLGRYPSKYLLLLSFSAAVLAALGLEYLLTADLRSRYPRLRFVLICTMLACGLVSLGLAAYWYFHPGTLESLLRREISATLVGSKDFPAIIGGLRGSLRATGLFLSLCAGVVLAAPYVKNRAIAPALLCILIVAEILPPNLTLSPLLSDADVDYVPEVNGFLQERFSSSMLVRVFPPTLSLARVGTELRVVSPNASAAWLTLFYRRTGQLAYGIMNGIQYSLDRSVDYLNTYESEALWKRCAGLTDIERVRFLQTINSPLVLTVGQMADPRLKRLRSFETHSNARLDLCWIENALPRAYFASGVRRVPSQPQALDALCSPEYSLQSTVILEGESAGETPPAAKAGNARVVEYGSDRVLCEVDAAETGHVVLLDSYYPGWKVYVDGVESRLLRANYAFRAVEVTPGRHQLEFRYRPMAFYAGLALSLCSTCRHLLLASALWRGRRTVSAHPNDQNKPASGCASPPGATRIVIPECPREQPQNDQTQGPWTPGSALCCQSCRAFLVLA